MSINAVSKIRQMFREVKTPLTNAQIKLHLPDLKPSDISMAMCYLLKQRYASRELLKLETPKARKSVWVYSYYDAPLPKDNSEAIIHSSTSTSKAARATSD
jgi:hypothetical protein